MREVKRTLSARPLFFLALFLMPFFALYSCFLYRTPEVSLDEGETVLLTGKVTNKTVSEDGRVDSFCIKGKYGFKCYAKEDAPPSETLPIGSYVRVRGTFHEFRSAGNPGEFDSASFNENRGYLFYLTVDRIDMGKSPELPVREFFFRMRAHCCEIVSKNCPLEHGTINTLLFGDRTELDDERQDIYRLAGLAHFLVISGLHVSVAGGGIYSLLKNLGMKRGPAAAVGMGFILLYGMLVGFSVSVFRAVIMYLFRLTADILNRTYDLLSAWGVAAVTVLLYQPLRIRDSSFLYSYVAVLFVGLYMTYLRPKFEGEIHRSLFKRRGFKVIVANLKKAAAPSVILYLSLLPISLYFQSYSNLLGIPLNLCLAVLTGPVLLFSAFGFLFGSIGLGFFAKIADFGCALLLGLTDGVCNFMSIKCRFYIVNRPNIWVIAIYYIALVTVFFIARERMARGMRVAVMSTFLLILSTNLAPFPSMTVLDVDQGDCIVFRTGYDSAVISDCGSTGRSDIGKNVVMPYLLSQGITRIEDIYISHSDSDHVNGVGYLLESSRKGPVLVKRVLFPKLRSDMWDEKLEEIRLSTLENRVKTGAVTRGDSFKYGKMTFTVLYPSSDDLTGDPNTDSLVIWANSGATDILLTGDATAETEAALRLPEGVTFEILKVAHHGSRFSSTEAFLETLSPQIALISAGRRNRYGHPHPETLSRLTSHRSQIYRTDRLGAISVAWGRFSCHQTVAEGTDPYCKSFIHKRQLNK